MGMSITINGTTGIAGVDGSAATPAVQGVDTNTGVFYGTDIVAISTGGTERMRVTNTGVALPTGTSIGSIAAGTASVAPLNFTSGTNLTTATAGAVEYDGKVFYATAQGTQRGIIPGAQFFRLNSDLAGANVNTVQSVFGVSVTLSTSTIYAFEAVYYFNKTAGATSHTLGIGYGGSATLNSILYGGIAFDGSTVLPTRASAGTSQIASASAANLVVTGAIASAASTAFISIKGIVSINGGGTFTPQYTLSAAPGGAYSTVAGSYFLIYPIGASGSNVNVGTWA
jgi:hypothetical protein